MTHWFDKVAKAAVASESGVSRRGALAGAAVAAFSASSLSSRGVAYAALRLESRAAQSSCQACLNASILNNNRDVKRCLRTGNPDGKIDRIKKGKKKGKASPVSAAKKLGCVARRHAELVEDLGSCRRHNCKGPSAPPVETEPGGAGCPTGTQECTPEICCVAGDLCCQCSASPTGYICCVSVVDCKACCGS
jgi:hypothetical protein